MWLSGQIEVRILIDRCLGLQSGLMFDFLKVFNPVIMNGILAVKALIYSGEVLIQVVGKEWSVGNNEAEIRERLQNLYTEHRDLDDVIERLSLDPSMDQLRLSRLKKKKLQIKDMIGKLEDELIPDDIA